MLKVILFTNNMLAAVVLATNLLFCGIGNIRQNDEEFTFCVLDVGQGLSQIGIQDNQAVVWDMGDSSAYSRWQEGYARLGRPYVKAIVISHSDRDHAGGLMHLPATFPFSGLIVTQLYDDTARIRQYASLWADRIYFKLIEKDDTLNIFNNVLIKCLWPPNRSQLHWPAEAFTKNRMSLCFLVRYKNSSVLITSDIDSCSEEMIADENAFNLRTDILIVPHHGSAGAYHPVFYGYSNPTVAVISCGQNNPFGHPAEKVTKMLVGQMHVIIFDTRYDGHIIGRSNGEYWVWQ